MQIVENTRETLILRHRRVVRPFIVGFFALLFLVMAFFAWFDAPPISAGLALIAAMLIFAIYVFDLIVSRAEFSRAKGTVTISHTRFGRGKTEVIKLGAIRKAFTMVSGTNAQVTGTMMDGGQKCPALELRQGKTVPLSAISNFNRSQEIAVQVVNEWLGRKPD